MLYKFKSRATADLIMLEPQGRQMVSLIGKAPGAKGIITVAQIPAAIAALEAAIAAETAALSEADTEGAGAPAEESTQEERRSAVLLHQRAAPFINMLRRSAAEDADVVWGV